MLSIARLVLATLRSSSSSRRELMLVMSGYLSLTALSRCRLSHLYVCYLDFEQLANGREESCSPAALTSSRARVDRLADFELGLGPSHSFVRTFSALLSSSWTDRTRRGASSPCARSSFSLALPLPSRPGLCVSGLLARFAALLMSNIVSTWTADRSCRLAAQAVLDQFQPAHRTPALVGTFVFGGASSSL